MSAGSGAAPERHVLARLDARGAASGTPVPITEDREGHDALLRLLGPPPVPVAMEATGHYRKNLYAALVAAGRRVALLDPLETRRFQDSGLERTETDAIDAAGIARFASEKRPEPPRSHDAAAEAPRELVRHRDRLRQDCDGRVRQLHRSVEPSFPEFTRYVRGLDSMLATCLLADCPTAHEFARATPRRPATPRYDGRHLVGAELAQQPVDAAERGIGRHHGPAYRLRARHIRQDLDLWRRRPAAIERDSDGLLESHEIGGLLPPIEGIGPRTAARIIAAVGDPARFESAAAVAAYVGVVPGLRQSGKNLGRRAARAPIGDARHAQAAPRRRQRRQESQAVHPRHAAGAGGVGPTYRSRPRLRHARKRLARRDGISRHEPPAVRPPDEIAPHGRENVPEGAVVHGAPLLQGVVGRRFGATSGETSAFRRAKLSLCPRSRKRL